MTIKARDEARLAARARLAETTAPSRATRAPKRGSAAASSGRNLLVEALGSEEALEKEIRRGRPAINDSVASGTRSTAIQVRVDPDREARLEALVERTHKKRSVLVREAIDLLLKSYEAPADEARQQSEAEHLQEILGHLRAAVTLVDADLSTL